MRKTLFVLALLAALLLCACGDGTVGGAGTTTASSGGQAIKFAVQTAEVDGVNYTISDIEGVTRYGEAGVVYAFAISADGANSTIDMLASTFSSSLTKYDTKATGHTILTVITAGSGVNSSYSIDKVEWQNGRFMVYVITKTGSDPSTPNTAGYHFIDLTFPVVGAVTVFLDGNQVK